MSDVDFVTRRAEELLRTVRRAEAELHALEKIPLVDEYEDFTVLRVKGHKYNTDLTYVLLKTPHSAGIRWYVTGRLRGISSTYLNGWAEVQEWLSGFTRIDEIVRLVPEGPRSEPSAENLAGEKVI